jgi:two-component system sensor histidine kinase PilS (NtrC family)
MAGLYDRYFQTRTDETDSQQQNRQIMTIYNLYRLVLALILLISYYFRNPTSSLGSVDQQLFFTLAVAYAVFNGGTLLFPFLRTSRPAQMLLYASIIITDILILVVLCYACGGMSSGMEPLLIVPVASGSLLFGIRVSTFFAAVASIAAIYSESYLYLKLPDTENYSVQAGLLGLLLFITALCMQLLGQRMRQKEALTRQQASHIQTLQQINQRIIQRMQTGVVVVDQNGCVLNHNSSAARLMGWPENSETPPPLPLILQLQLRNWLAESISKPALFRLATNEPEIQANFAYLQPGTADKVLIYLEDHTQLSSRAQHLKLMGLGRLTASIAHEIRNPLGAISHAAQLLSESAWTNPQDQRLLDIVNAQTQRISGIIQNILELSKQRQEAPERIELVIWLNNFIERLRQSYKYEVMVLIDNDSSTVWTRFNARHLEQLLTNLCDNGLRYSRRATGDATLKLHVAVNPQTQCAYMDIIDDGEGVPDENAEQIFEPFFTTDPEGTGLGLFICKELCEANQARLFYQRTAQGKSAFHISFAHPDRHLF